MLGSVDPSRPYISTSPESKAFAAQEAMQCLFPDIAEALASMCLELPNDPHLFLAMSMWKKSKAYAAKTKLIDAIRTEDLAYAGQDMKMVPYKHLKPPTLKALTFAFEQISNRNPSATLEDVMAALRRGCITAPHLIRYTANVLIEDGTSQPDPIEPSIDLEGFLKAYIKQGRGQTEQELIDFLATFGVSTHDAMAAR